MNVLRRANRKGWKRKDRCAHGKRSQQLRQTQRLRYKKEKYCGTAGLTFCKYKIILNAACSMNKIYLWGWCRAIAIPRNLGFATHRAQRPLHRRGEPEIVWLLLIMIREDKKCENLSHVTGEPHNPRNSTRIITSRCIVSFRVVVVDPSGLSRLTGKKCDRDQDIWTCQ